MNEQDIKNLPQAVIFDWDNTLVDSWGTIHTALNLTFDEFGLENWTIDEAKDRVAKSLRDSFPALFGEDRWELAKDRFYFHFEAIHLETLSPLNGAFDLIKALHERGVYLGVVSNKTGKFLRKEVSHLGWSDMFGAIVGATDAERDKPAPDPVHMVMGDNQAKNYPDMWFVGDSIVDVQCARAVGAQAILVGESMTGHGDDGKSQSDSPDWQFVDCEAIVRVVKGLPNVL